MNTKKNFKNIFCLLSLILTFAVSAEAQRSRRPRTPAVNQPAAVSVNPMTNQIPKIDYTVSMSKPWTHLLEVEMRLSSADSAPNLDLIMPVWTPGSYLMREYARHIQDFSVKNASGNALEWQKTTKNIWRVNTGDAREIVVNYRVYANELTVRTNELNDEHAFFTPAALLMYPKDALNAPSTIKVVPYGNWKIATGLPRDGENADTFRAENYDILYDSPFEVSNFKETSFTFQNVPHRIVFTGEGNYELEKVRVDVEKIVRAASDIFGGLPYKDYTFIVNLRGGGGLEHLNSTALQWNRFGFQPASRYQGFLSLVAHEFFHAWNVKRIRPDALGPFDYSNENYTKLLWAAEGGTSYYENLLLVRAGLMTDKEFLAEKARQIQDLMRRPGRFQTSVEEASFDAWIKYYRQDENSINNQISYYDKGDLMMMMLDLEIRRSSGGAKSMDDVFRTLFSDFYKQNRNYTPADFQRIAEMHAGKSLEDFFRKYVRGREEVDFNSVFASYGIRLDMNEGAKKTPYLGADTAEQNGRVTVRAVAADTPAYEFGINANDEIVAVDGNRATTAFLNSYIAEKKVGDKIRLTVFRFDQMRDFEVTLGGRSAAPYAFKTDKDVSDSAKKLYKDWLKTDLK